mmetsp:Transcript_28794/g.79067  ORF Transcript_28794/g.79067 Transcript_28794/m.79067 type:complete len:134 (+) Transcript_28794:93-494(+)|eukprot:CAMPEP_0168736652 /NCGR_PEP_ID=MMETSP0724-20121128/9971_1 /TAXON_ID=265536 /ORGANISM="Amphiprora sp., Strain CCMP467" /LENGTH=133 /DNA_ID=CAMNT_0008783857 /DNA_START=99 /DNA_END=500 /DNA_ORIENTATION=+
MKLLVTLLISFLAGIAAFAPQQQQAKSSTSLQAEVSRAGFLSAAAMAIMAPAAASAMDQVLVKDPTEVWETGTPNADAEKARMARYTNARTQLNSNFAPIKRLNLERKSPVTRLDINYPDFGAYKKTYPGLFK